MEPEGVEPDYENRRSDEMRVKHERWHKDSAGQTANDVEKKFPAGSTWFHSKTGRLYTVGSIMFDSERERWVLAYSLSISSVSDRITYLHLPEDFGRYGRFLRVTG